MKRIGLYLASVPHGGGAFQYSMAMLNALSSLPRDHYEVIAAYCHQDWRPLVEHYGIGSVYAPVSAPSYLSAYVWRKIGLPVEVWRRMSTHVDSHSRHLASLNCDLWVYPAQDPMSYMLPVPALGTVHDVMHRYEGQFPEVSGYRLREYHYRAICRFSRGVLVDSELGERQLVESYGVNPDKVWPLNYIPPAYILKGEDPPDFCDRYKLPDKFFFYPAQFWAHKNHISLVRAMHSLFSTCPDMQLVLVGSRKNGYARFLHEIQRLGVSDRVHVFDYVENRDMSAFYRRARALIMPTFFGPTNIPPLEAMALGCPVGISGVYGMRAQCGAGAIYLDPKSVDDIARVLKTLWTDDALCKELARQGTLRSSEFTQERFNEKLAQILGEMDL